MTGQNGRAELIGRQLRDSLRDKTRGCRIVKIAKHANVFTCGEIASSSVYLTIEHKISHEELSKMVGTTRPRIREFMRRFRELGLIETSAQHCLVVRDKDLSDYLSQLASC